MAAGAGAVAGRLSVRLQFSANYCLIKDMNKKLESDRVFSPVAAWPEGLRPRERLLADGPAALSDAELLAILLRTGRRGQTVVDVARSVLSTHGGLDGCATLHWREWVRNGGVGRAKAATVVAALELGRRTWATGRRKHALGLPQDVYDYAAPRFFGATYESMWVLGLDAKNQVLVDAIVSRGTADRTPAHPREVFAPLLRSGAIKGLLLHNHPSGDPEPSRQDLALTQRMVRAGELLGISLVDHVIIGDGCFVSLQARGALQSGN